MSDSLSSKWRTGLLVLLIVLVSSPYLAASLANASGRPTSPLDDAYITYQYTRQIARGHTYQYSDGDLPTTGMTSPLFGFLLAIPYRLGLTGERIIALAVGMGVIWLGLIAWLTYRLTSRVMGEKDTNHKWALAAAAIVALTGSVQWGCFNGMETGFFTVLTLAALDAFLAGRIRLCTLWLALAGLTRPEGLVLATLIWIATLASNLPSPRAALWKPLAVLSVAVMAGLVPSLVNWMLTGTTTSAALQAKSWLFNVPRYPVEAARTMLWSYQRILHHFLGWAAADNWLLPPGLLLFSMVGCIGLGTHRRWRAVMATSSWFLLGTLSLATLITATWHQGRYLVPFVPVAIALAAYGMASLLNRAGQQWQRATLGLIALFFLTASAYASFRYHRYYRNSANTMAQQHTVTADWLRESLPPDARVAVTDAGILRYVSERPTYDMIGLTTAGAAITWRNGPGSIFEQMERSPMRPDYFATHPSISFVPYLKATDLFAEELFRVEVTDHVGSAGAVQGVWRADWRLAGSGARFYQTDIAARIAGLELVDTLDVADLDDETAHHVTWWESVHRYGFATEVQQLTYRVRPEREVLDGGRLLTGGIAFDVATRAGEPLWIVARLHALDTGAVRVEIDGRDVGRWAYPLVPGQWLETIFDVPAEAITSPRTRVALRAELADPAIQYYAPYHFWFLQGRPEEIPPEIKQQVNASFDEGISLLGFDLENRTWRPGDAVPVTLYWQATSPIESDAKAFLHLYDADGNLGPQADGWPFHGTRPPFTWWPGEIVTDPQAISLPPDLPPGRYSLEIGLYDPDDLIRLPAYQDDVRQSKDRVPLAVIRVAE